MNKTRTFKRTHSNATFISLQLSLNKSTAQSVARKLDKIKATACAGRHTFSELIAIIILNADA